MKKSATKNHSRSKKFIYVAELKKLNIRLVFSGYTELISISHEKKQNTIEQKFEKNTIATHKYDVCRYIDNIMFAAEQCMNDSGWIDNGESDLAEGEIFYRLVAEYYDESKVPRRGGYNRRDIPEKSWMYLLSAIANQMIEVSE